MALWTTPIVSQDDIFSSINNSMCLFTDKYKSSLPYLHDADTILCFSDYSGEEKEARYFVYSFLIISNSNLQEWNMGREKIRREFLTDGRRISYKNYRDKLSQNFIKSYLEKIDKLNGYLITFSVSKDVPSIFKGDSPVDLSSKQFHDCLSWTKDTVEKAFRIMHFLGFFISGLTREYQNLLWITDNDKIAPNDDRVTQLTKLFSYVCTVYLNHNLGHLRVGTTKVDNGSRLVEDLCAIPDLIAGAYSDQLKNPESDWSDEAGKIFWMRVPHFKEKTNILNWWLATSNDKLCKLCFRIDKSSEGMCNTSFYHFFDRE